MLGTVNLAAFAAAGVLLNLYPGPDTMYIIGRSLSQGRGAGVISALGISTGGLCHTLLAAFGLASILVASPDLFLMLKAAGALYLIYLGIRCLIGSGVGDGGASRSYLGGQGNSRIYLQGVLTNLLNPKVALFFLSFLPQFVDPRGNYGVLSFLFLGGIFLTTGTVWCMLVAVFSARVSESVRRNRKGLSRLEKLTGLLYLALGIMIFL